MLTPQERPTIRQNIRNTHAMALFSAPLPTSSSTRPHSTNIPMRSYRSIVSYIRSGSRENSTLAPSSGGIGTRLKKAQTDGEHRRRH